LEGKKQKDDQKEEEKRRRERWRRRCGRAQCQWEEEVVEGVRWIDE